MLLYTVILNNFYSLILSKFFTDLEDLFLNFKSDYVNFNILQTTSCTLMQSTFSYCIAIRRYFFKKNTRKNIAIN